jgi:hypothetical protein
MVLFFTAWYCVLGLADCSSKHTQPGAGNEARAQALLADAWAILRRARAAHRATRPGFCVYCVWGLLCIIHITVACALQGVAGAHTHGAVVVRVGGRGRACERVGGWLAGLRAPWVLASCCLLPARSNTGRGWDY